MQQGPLRETGSARCVLDHARIGGPDLGQGQRFVHPRAQEGIPLIEAHHFSQLGAVGLNGLQMMQHAIAAELW